MPPIDRTEFLRLTTLLALAACEACDRRGPTPIAIDVPPEKSATTAAPASVTAPPPPPPSTAPAATVATTGDASAALIDQEDRELSGDPLCSNAVGNLAACKRIGPACEGLASECRQLLPDLRPRVAEKFAECFAKTHGPTCRDRELGACMRKAVESACIEPGSVKKCHAIMDACRAAHRKPTYTLDQCTRVLSAVAPGHSGGWDKVDEERLGPGSGPAPTKEGCSLEYVLPYQPWGASWK